MKRISDVLAHRKLEVVQVDAEGSETLYGVHARLWHRSTRLAIIASTGGGWDHVSVSTATRCPTWDEMEVVRRIFFKAEEGAFQLGVPASEHVNRHRYCLHWWRPQHEPIPQPPMIYV